MIISSHRNALAVIKSRGRAEGYFLGLLLFRQIGVVLLELSAHSWLRRAKPPMEEKDRRSEENEQDLQKVTVSAILTEAPQGAHTEG